MKYKVEVEFSGHTTGHSSYYEDRGRGFAERGDKFRGDDPRGFWIVVTVPAVALVEARS